MDLIKFILEYAAKEWAFVKTAPGAAFVLCALVFLVAYFVFNWRYAGAIESLTGQNALLSKQVDDYKERLGLLPPDRTAYSKLTIKELKDVVAEFVVKLHEFADRSEKLKPDLRTERSQAVAAAKDDNERQQIANRYYEQEIALYNRRSELIRIEYEQNFRVKAVILRDEMLRRLPPPDKQRMVIYDSLAGATPIYDIAMDLQRLSTLIPDRETR